MTKKINSEENNELDVINEEKEKEQEHNNPKPISLVKKNIFSPNKKMNFQPKAGFGKNIMIQKPRQSSKGSNRGK